MSGRLRRGGNRVALESSNGSHRPIPGERGRDSRYGCYSPQRAVLLQMGLQQTEAIRRDLSALLPGAPPIGPYWKRTPNTLQSPLSGGIHLQENFAMELVAFIRANEDVIVAEWAAFAHTYLPSAAHLDRSSLRDHIVGLLRFIADDLETSETERERSEKAKGQGPKEGGSHDSAAETHATLRFTGGFDTIEMIAEFRALRASVIKLWRAEWAESDAADILPDLLRFNEAIDQVMTESLGRFAQKFTQSGSLFVGTLVHEFRGPLTAVQNSAQALLMRPLRANIDETVLPVVITEQGENRDQCEEQRNIFGFSHGFACRCTPVVLASLVLPTFRARSLQCCR